MLYLFIFNISYEKYSSDTKMLTFLLVPVTICLTVPLYENFYLLKKYGKIVIISLLVGMITNFTLIFFLSKLFCLNYASFINVLSKSVTTSVGVTISKEYSGNESVSASIIIITGLIGSILADFIFTKINVENKIAKGIALGTTSHAMGTTKSIEYGEDAVGVATLCMILAGILTVLSAIFISKIY